MIGDHRWRKADPAGICFWMNYLDKGSSLDGMAAGGPPPVNAGGPESDERPTILAFAALPT